MNAMTQSTTTRQSRGTPEPFARKRPIDVVAQEISEAAVADRFGKPIDLGVIGQTLGNVIRCSDVPGRRRVLAAGPPMYRDSSHER